ncbi:RsmB/NOP family class I SAM-dependent RNA methyltransferase [Thermodesulfobacteriota bacterium]
MTIFENYRDFIPDFFSFQDSLKIPLPVHIRINNLKTEPAALCQRLREKGIVVELASENHKNLLLVPELNFPGHLIEYFLGQVHPQAFTSCMVSLALSPAPESSVLDMCASPGGKTSHLCQIMNNSGLIIANELYSRRHIALGHTLSRLGALNTLITDYQAQEFPLKQRFDYILADVPCSGEGRFRTTEERALPPKKSEGNRLTELQKKIILRGFDLLSPAGVMVYATCTYNPKENESVVDFLLRNRDAVLLPMDFRDFGDPGDFRDPGLKHESGIETWEGETYHAQLRRAIRFYPHQINSVGFFLAKISRRS